MCAVEYDSYFSGMMIGIIVFCTAMLFYFTLLGQRDATGFKIMECMGSDRSRDSYEMCRLKIVEGVQPENK